MTGATRRRTLGALGTVTAAGIAVLLGANGALGLEVDDRGEMRLGMRAYTDVRIATEKRGGSDDPLSFPKSATGHVQQHRYFLELKFDHDLKRLGQDGWGLARAIGWLDPSELKYSVQYRGEGEGIYDYGPSEYSDEFTTTKAARVDLPKVSALGINLSPILPDELVRRRVNLLRRLGRQRHRLFLAYIDVAKGPLFVRIGRQILAWGETDIFRLLDNINPLDSSFGGFLISLDERRVPLDMLRMNYHLGSVGPVSDAFIEGFGALGDRVSTFPGTPNGSVWIPGGLAYPNPAVRSVVDVPAKDDFRGGARLVFNAADVTYTLAHYYTYLDTPGVQFRIPGQFPGFGHEIIATQRFPRVPITGGSLTFPVSSYYSVVRAEAAYFNGEPMNRQGRGNSADVAAGPGTPGYARLAKQNNLEGSLDPFVYPGFLDLQRLVVKKNPIVGKLMRRDTFNMALGLDVNRYVRWLNPGQTFLITTQFFYKHVFDSPGDLILPVPHHNQSIDSSLLIIGTGCGPKNARRACRLEPRFFHLNDDQFLQTLAVFTSYSGGRVLPTAAVFYDWQGAILVQPGVTFVRDPFRFLVDYTRIEGPPTGQIGTLRDRDNVRFQVEYVF